MDAQNHSNSRRIDEHVLSVLERHNRINDSLQLAVKLLDAYSNPTIIRALFRICRKKGDYTEAERYLKRFPEIISEQNFNIQYELAYYFYYKKNEESLQRSLRIIRSSASGSIPISRTLYNFYLKFNMFEDAKIIQERISKLQEEQATKIRTKKPNDDDKSRQQSEAETDSDIINIMQSLVKENTANRQRLAMFDLLKGFSHELGQPITNIRYAIQLHQMKQQREIFDKDEIISVLDNILKQTERIGGLLARFRPIVSSKGVIEYFNVYQRILSLFREVGARLAVHETRYSLSGDRRVFVYGDPVQFDQIILNLINNSIHAITQNKRAGIITVYLRKIRGGGVKITFTDNGIGIPMAVSQKIFEPFVTTREPSDEPGGEGLGLFIIWNMVQVFNGKVKLNLQYEDGAQFIINLKGASKHE